MSKNLRPLHDRVVVKRTEAESTTASGIVLPGSASEKPDLGTVLAVGPGKPLEGGGSRAPSVKPGDRVLFSKFAGQSAKLGSDECLILREEDILAVAED